MSKKFLNLDRSEAERHKAPSAMKRTAKRDVPRAGASRQSTKNGRERSVNLPSGLRLDIEDAPADADVEVLPNGLEAFNESRWPKHQPWKPLAVFVRDSETIVAGLAGETYSGWLFIRYLWVSDGLRGKGIGRRLMAAGETRALERGSDSAWVHRAFSNAKTWALGVYHGLRRQHLQSYRDEFVFRFNRRRTRHAAFRSLSQAPSSESR